MKTEILLPLAFLFLTISACGIYGVRMKTTPESIKSNNLEITISKVKTGAYNTNYYIYAKIKNNGKEELTFDSGDLELTNEKSGLTYYSISKDKSSVTVPATLNNLITRITLKPQRATEGVIWISTPNFKAKGKKLKLIYGDQSFSVHR